MDGETPSNRSNSTPEMRYDGPPDYRLIGAHDMFPEMRHDDYARFNFLAHMNRHLASQVMPGVKEAFEARVEPAFEKEKGRGYESRHEIRRSLLNDRFYQAWSALRRNTMEMRQQAGRWVTLSQKEQLNDKAAKAVADGARLELNGDVALPRYVSAIDHHCMPGSYHTETTDGDVVNGANYDMGLYVTSGGMLGRFTDGGGEAVVGWVKKNLPDFKPKRILDIGCTIGHSSLPLAKAFPDAEVVAVDVGAPMLRYGAARAKSLGVDNIKFVQGNAEDLAMFEDESFDWVQSTMFLHETSFKSMQNIFKESHRLLKPSGLAMHVEQPTYTDDMPLFEQAMRDWDSFYNNEPFWSKLHEIDVDDFLEKAGFDRSKFVHADAAAVMDPDLFPNAHEDEDEEDYGRKAAWEVVGAFK